MAFSAQIYMIVLPHFVNSSAHQKSSLQTFYQNFFLQFVISNLFIFEMRILMYYLNLNIQKNKKK